MYSEEFRRAVVCLTESRPAAHVARDVGISPETLLKWRRAMLALGETQKGMKDGTSS